MKLWEVLPSFVAGKAIAKSSWKHQWHDFLNVFIYFRDGYIYYYDDGMRLEKQGDGLSLPTQFGFFSHDIDSDEWLVLEETIEELLARPTNLALAKQDYENRITK